MERGIIKLTGAVKGDEGSIEIFKTDDVLSLYIRVYLNCAEAVKLKKKMEKRKKKDFISNF